MNNIEKAIEQYCDLNLTNENNWYNWSIDMNNLPEQINISDGNNYEQNIQLKQDLNKLWAKTNNQEEKENLIKYYIKDWGGIRTNRPETIKKYTASTAEELINTLGKRGIASWSKALVVKDFENYAIFDARVSISLNCIQILHKKKDIVLFPILSSRNNVIKRGNDQLKILARNYNWTKVSENNFYMQYIDILKSVAKAKETNISTIEMLLFAKAEELVLETFFN
jgi:disulfide oxidoreductase YuzD